MIVSVQLMYEHHSSTLRVSVDSPARSRSDAGGEHAAAASVRVIPVVAVATRERERETVYISKNTPISTSSL